MKHEPWHEMRAWCVESARTAMRLPRVPGPKEYGNNWPEFQFEREKDYAPDKTPIRLRPTPQQISRMESFCDLVNEHLDEHDRKAVFQYGTLRLRRQISRYLRENDENPAEYFRALNPVFKRLFEIATSKGLLLRNRDVATSEKTGTPEAHSEVLRSPTYMRTAVQDNRTPAERLKERNRVIAKLQKRYAEIRMRNAEHKAKKLAEARSKT